MFDIHKVKPVHGWREFIGEVGIIVLGVVIALALEYFVEVAHWHNKVAESTEAVKQSAANHVFAAVEQQMSEPCIEKQLDILEQRLLAPGPFKPVKRQIDRSTISYVVRGPSRIWADSVWNIAVAEGISTHYDPEFRQSLDLFYSQLSDMRGIAHEVDNLNAQLNVLSLPIPMSNTTIAHAAESIESLRAKEQLLSLRNR